MPCVYLPGPAPAVTVANTNNQLQITTAVFNPSQIITYAVEIVCTNNQVFLLPY